MYRNSQDGGVPIFFQSGLHIHHRTSGSGYPRWLVSWLCIFNAHDKDLTTFILTIGQGHRHEPFGSQGKRDIVMMGTYYSAQPIQFEDNSPALA